MKLAWVVLLVACAPESRDAPPPSPPPTPRPPAVAPKKSVSVDQILECYSDPRVTSVPQTMSALLLRDVDRDGRTDALVTYETLDNDVFTGHLAVYRNAGDAKLVEHSRIVAGDMVYAVSAGDIDNDGKVDVAIGDPRGGKTRLFAGQGDGTFVEKPAFPAARKPYGATLVDLDRDGNLDLVNELFSHVQVSKGDGKFGFKRAKVIDTGQAPDGPVAADLDGDKIIDLGYASNDDGFFFTLKGPAYKQTVKDASCGEPAYTSGGDFDDDGDIDIGYVCNDHLELRLNDGAGKFELRTHPYGPPERPIVAADLTGDGKTDLLVSHRVMTDYPMITARLVLLEGAGNGDFRVRATATVPTLGGVQVADMDGDQRLDIVLATWTGNKAAIWVLLKQDC